jgi:hypothetical protein
MREFLLALVDGSPGIGATVGYQRQNFEIP